jgi:hypothetical protein
MEEGKQREQRRARGGGGEEDECGGWILYIGAVVWVGESEAFIEVLRSSRPSVGLGSPTAMVFVEAQDKQTKGLCPLGFWAASPQPIRALLRDTGLWAPRANCL